MQVWFCPQPFVICYKSHLSLSPISPVNSSVVRGYLSLGWILLLTGGVSSVTSQMTPFQSRKDMTPVRWGLPNSTFKLFMFGGQTKMTNFPKLLLWIYQPFQSNFFFPHTTFLFPFLLAMVLFLIPLSCFKGFEFGVMRLNMFAANEVRKCTEVAHYLGKRFCLDWFQFDSIFIIIDVSCRHKVDGHTKNTVQWSHADMWSCSIFLL